MREKLIMDDHQKNFDKMHEGVPGAMSILADIMQLPQLERLDVMMKLDDMNIRGHQLWYAYGYYCHYNLSAFVKAVDERSPAMVEMVNEMAMRGGVDAVAVCKGAVRDRMKLAA